MKVFALTLTVDVRWIETESDIHPRGIGEYPRFPFVHRKEGGQTAE